MDSTIIGVSKNIERIRELIDQVADTGLNTVVYGETGVGKELVVQNLYQKSNRTGKPFVKVNCAALPDTLLESEMFGYEQGAFTGADRRKRGKFEQASGGLLFLDEIGDMSLPLQSKLLHVLQGGDFSPLGSEKNVKMGAWIITATNRELEGDMVNGKFREDLYYRLNVIPIHIPPLRERPDDIPALINYFAQKYSVENQITAPRIEPNLISFLSRLNWQGNIRQLENTLKRMLVLNHKTLSISDVPEEFKHGENSFFNTVLIDHHSLEDVSKKYVKMVLDHVQGNKKVACELLKINYRTLQKKIEE